MITFSHTLVARQTGQLRSGSWDIQRDDSESSPHRASEHARSRRRARALGKARKARANARSCANARALANVACGVKRSPPLHSLIDDDAPRCAELARSARRGGTAVRSRRTERAPPPPARTWRTNLCGRIGQAAVRTRVRGAPLAMHASAPWSGHERRAFVLVEFVARGRPISGELGLDRHGALRRRRSLYLGTGSGFGEHRCLAKQTLDRFDRAHVGDATCAQPREHADRLVPNRRGARRVDPVTVVDDRDGMSAGGERARRERGRPVAVERPSTAIDERYATPPDARSTVEIRDGERSLRKFIARSGGDELVRCGLPSVGLESRRARLDGKKAAVGGALRPSPRMPWSDSRIQRDGGGLGRTWRARAR